jgi:catechol 2,3-dioxygenase-like lactoylglutathione lyase family enzyme
MDITELHLQTPQLAAQRVFYATTLGLPLVEETADSFLVQAGQTRLAFHGITESAARYHFAFTIPGRAWQQAKAWLETRMSLLRRDGQDVFFIDIWNAHSLYFQDAAGNVGEFIAHHESPAEPSEAFGVEDILRLSEIGLVGEDVPALVDQLHSQLSLDPYKGFSHREFTAVGDICGLFIVVQTGRIWFPTVSEPAVVAPFQVTIKGPHPQHYHLTPFPYDITVVAQE